MKKYSKSSSVAAKISEACVGNPLLTMFIGILFIIFGISIHEFYNDIPVNSSTGIWQRVHWSTIFYHFFVIFGEAIFVMFVLHVAVEQSNHRAHRQATEKSMIELQHTSIAILSDLKYRIEDVFNAMTTAFKIEGQETLKALKSNLFSAILQDKMPAPIVEVILKNDFFITTFLRRKLTIEYVYKYSDVTSIFIEQRIKFEMEYIAGDQEKIAYAMPFSLSNTPLAQYEFVEASYKSKSAEDACPYTNLTKEEHFYVKETIGEKSAFELCDPIQITKNEIITVEQIFHSKYSLENGMYDSYHVTNHTIGVSVIFDLPKEFEVEIYPTFPEKYLPLRRYNGSQIIFDPIKFMVPGQGFGFSIKKL